MNQLARIAMVLICLGAAACAQTHLAPQTAQMAMSAMFKPVAVRARVSGAADLPGVDAGYYADAAAAIGRRDYARALELLQAARARRPDDVRVLNAFGVVYDKLGRFDLSARYYAQAKALDPQSQIVARNMAYSALLQGLATGQSRALSLASVPTAPAAPVAVAPTNLAQAPPLALPPCARPPTTRRCGLSVIDATGQASGAYVVQARLVQLGWSAAPPLENLPRRSGSQIFYPRAKAAVARALAMTLPVRVRLAPCQSACPSIQLLVGADLTSWRPAAPERPQERPQLMKRA